MAALRKFDPSGPEDRLVKVYRDAYAELLKTIERKEARGNITVYEHSLLADVQRILSGIDKDMKGWVERDLPLIYQGAAENVYEAYARARVELPPFNTSFAKVHEQAVRVLADNLTNNLNEATSFVGRRINDQFRKISIEVITSKTATGKTVREAKKLLMQEIGDSGLGAFVDRRGRQWRLDTYSEMVVRSTTREATNTGLMDQLTDLDKDLVQISSHAFTCSICSPYAGRVYSMSGRDERFPALSTVPGFADGYHNIHPNCRHVITPYIEELQDDVEGDIRRSNSPLKDTRTRQQIERYDQGQDELRQLRADRKQWEKYRMYLPDDAPKTLAGFRRMKASNSERYQELQGMLREAKTIDS